MQDVTDIAYMRTLARIGSLPDLFITPYFRSTATTLALTEHNLRCIEENETGVPVIAQLAGSAAAALVRDAAALLTLPIAGINLNMGCPSPLVNRHGAGAGLLRDLPHLQEVLHALRDAVPAGRFSVKTRIGWSNRDEFPAILELIADAAPDEVMIHGRTRGQLYSGTPDWDAVQAAAQKLACPVWANGDLQTAAEVRSILARTGATDVLIGRGAVRNPYLFRELHGGPPPSAEEMKTYYITLLEEIGRAFSEHRTEKGHCNRMKKYLTFCYPDLGAETEYRLRRCTSTAEMARLLTR